MAVPARELSLCSGYGGLGLGVSLALSAGGYPWPSAEAVCYVEREAYAVACLAARMASGDLADAPVWSDLRTFDGRRWRGAVDLVTAGYPCQGESDAGLRRGTDDERWLWHHVWRIVRDVGPRYVFLENVAAHLGRSFRHVVGDMAASGWRVEWDCVPAAAVGAPHLRDRVFVLAANPDGADVWEQRRWREPRTDASIPGDRGAERTAANPDVRGFARERIGRVLDDERTAQRDHTHGRDGAATEVPNPDGRTGPFRRFGRTKGAEGAWDVHLGVPEPSIRGVDDGTACGLELRTNRLHLLGNGVVPQAAALAWRVLWGRMHGEVMP